MGGERGEPRPHSPTVLPIRAIPWPVLRAQAGARRRLIQEEGRMDGLLNLSNAPAAAVERAGRVVFGVNGGARLGSTGVHWRRGLVVTADHTVHVDDEVSLTRPHGPTVTARVPRPDPPVDAPVPRAP